MQQFYPVIIAIIFHILDVMSGMMSAVKRKDINSSRLRDGLFKKVGFLFCYLLAWIIDTQGAKIGFDITVKILPTIIFYSVTTELISILENISQINSDLLPTKLMGLFHLDKKGD